MKKNVYSCKKRPSPRKTNSISIALEKRIEDANEKKSENLKKKVERLILKRDQHETVNVARKLIRYTHSKVKAVEDFNKEWVALVRLFGFLGSLKALITRRYLQLAKLKKEEMLSKMVTNKWQRMSRKNAPSDYDLRIIQQSAVAIIMSA